MASTISNQMIVLAFSTTLMFACGSSASKKEEQKRLDENTVTFSPPPGTYEYGVVVVAKKKDEGTGSGLFETKKADGSWGLAYDSCVGGVDTAANCLVFNESKVVSYRLSTLGGEGSEKSIEYKIAPLQKNVKVNDKEYSEQKTECAASSSGGVTTVSGRIKLKNDAVLGADKIAYLLFKINDASKLNEDLTISSADYATGFSIKGNGDSAATSPSEFYPGRNSSSTTDKCVVKLTGFSAGGKATGEMQCDLSLGEYTDATVLGKTLKIPKTEWQCDSWVSSI